MHFLDEFTYLLQSVLYLSEFWPIAVSAILIKQ